MFHLLLFIPLWFYSVNVGSIQLYSVHIGPIQSIPSTSVLFSLIWLYSVQFGLIRFIWYYSVHCGTIWSIYSTLVLFGTFSLPWSYSVHFFFFWITPIRYIESEWVSHFMRNSPTELPSDYHPNSKQVPSNFKSHLKNWTTNDTFRSKFSRTCYINPMNLVSLGLSHPNPR